MKHITKLVTLLLAASLAATPVLASSDSSITKSITLKVKDVVTEEQNIDLKIDLDDTLKSGDYFYLTLSNAQWYSAGDLVPTLQANDYIKEGSVIKSTDTYTLNYDLESKNTLKVTYTSDSDLSSDATIYIPLLLKVTGKKPVVKVSSNTTISTETVTIGKVYDTDFAVEIDGDVPSFYDSGALAPLILTETTKGSFYEAADGRDELNIDFYLDTDDFEYSGISNIQVQFSKGFHGAVNPSDYSWSISDDHTLRLSIKADALKDLSEVGEIYISNINIKNTEDDFSEGSLKCDVSIGSSTQTVEVAKIVNKGLNIKCTPERKWSKGMPAGRKTNFTLDIKEGAKDAISSKKSFDIDFENGYIITVDPKDSKAAQLSYVESKLNLSANLKLDSIRTKNNKVTSLSFTADTEDDVYDELKIKFPFTAYSEGIIFKAGSNNETVDAKAKFSGRALLTDQEVTLSKVSAPVSLNFSKSDLKLGQKNQAAGEITITENLAGALQKGTLSVFFDNEEGVRFSAIPTVKVSSGDVKLGNGKLLRSGNKVYGVSFPVTGTSKTAATIQISDIKLLVDRTVASGDVVLSFDGDAITDDDPFTTSEYVAIGDATAAEQQILQQQQQIVQQQKNIKAASFVIGDKTYNIKGERAQMDVAPYIENGRTYLPLKYAAFGCGLAEKDIHFSNSIATVVGDKVAQVKIGSDVLILNGAKMQMDAPVVLKDGRAMLPVAWIAQALGLQTSYDTATKTVYIYSSNATLEEAKALLGGTTTPLATTPSVTTPTVQPTTQPTQQPTQQPTTTTTPSVPTASLNPVETPTQPTTTQPTTTQPTTQPTTTRPTTQQTTQQSSNTGSNVIVFE